MLACGVGITPLLALLWDLPYGHGQATLVYRARHAAEVAFLDELEWLAQRRGVRLVPLIGPRAHPTSWLPAEYADYPDAEALREIAPDIAEHDLYLCGPDRWTDAVRAAARAVGVPAAHLHRERFSW
jgi:ferredoxin-NADP reductase